MPGSKRRRLLHAIVPQDVLDCVRYLLSRVEEDDYPWMWGPTPVWYEDSDHEDEQAETDRQHFEAMEAASREGGQPTPAGGDEEPDDPEWMDGTGYDDPDAYWDDDRFREAEDRQLDRSIQFEQELRELGLIA